MFVGHIRAGGYRRFLAHIESVSIRDNQDYLTQLEKGSVPCPTH
jgi:hypothetical protein